MNKLIIAEKPMLARDIARVLCGTQKIPAKGNGFTVVSCAGHLLELKEPHEINPRYEKWDFEDLPISFKPWKKKIAKGKRDLLNTIKTELAKCDSVINAGDPDDEGQLIVDEILEFLGYKGMVERVYINDSIDKNIAYAFKKLKDNKDCCLQGRAALGRQLADMCFGVNESRLASLRTRKPVSVGRVQTPTLGLVVKRDLDIQNHICKKYYELYFYAQDIHKVTHKFKFIAHKNFLNGNKYIFDAKKLKDVYKKVPNEFDLIPDLTQKTINPPLPFNLTKLQSEMSKKYGYSAKQTLQITQSLRDRYKAITYNRTDCQYLSEEHHKNAANVMKYVLSNLGNVKNKELIDFTIHHKAFNDKNITAHHAIIPQEINIDINLMTEGEKNLYIAICESYIRLFMPPQKLLVSTTTLEIDEGKFELVYEKVVEEGWKVGSKEKNCNWLESKNTHFTRLDNKPIDNLIESHETKPPKPYTEGTLIADMASIAKYCKNETIKRILKKKDEDKKGEHGGIGTTATRADIIEKLKARRFIEKKGKTIRSTKLGQEFFKIIPDDSKNADITALWWLIQEDITNGKVDAYSIMDSVLKTFNSHKDFAYKGVLNNNMNADVVAICPVCGKNVVATGKIYQCASNKSQKQQNGEWKEVAGCGFKMFGTVAKKKLTKGQVKRLCAGNTVEVKGMKSKNGKSFNCGLKLKRTPDTNGFYGIEFVFN